MNPELTEEQIAFWYDEATTDERERVLNHIPVEGGLRTWFFQLDVDDQCAIVDACREYNAELPGSERLAVSA